MVPGFGTWARILTSVPEASAPIQAVRICAAEIRTIQVAPLEPLPHYIGEGESISPLPQVVRRSAPTPGWVRGRPVGHLIPAQG